MNVDERKRASNLMTDLNDRGFPIPLIRYKGEGNPALTLVVISAILVIIGIVGKWSGHFGGIDMSFAMQFFYASSTLFFGHSWIHKDPKDDVDMLNPKN